MSWLKRAAILLPAFCLALFLAAPAARGADNNSWTNLGDGAPHEGGGGRAFPPGTAVGDSFYIYGGNNDGDEGDGSVGSSNSYQLWRYQITDPATGRGQWSNVGSGTSNQTTEGYMVSDGSRLFIVGGHNNDVSGWAVSDKIRLMPLPSGSMTDWVALDGSRDGPAAAVIGGWLYVHGGQADEFLSNPSKKELRRYNLSNGQKENLTDGPERSDHAAAVLDGKLYIFGGSSGTNPTNGPDYNELWRYDPAANSWTKVSSSGPQARHQGGLAAINGKLYVFGGRTAGNTKLADLWEFDPATNTWRQLASIPEPLKGFAWGVVNQRLYVFGGKDASNNPRNTLYMYDRTLGTPGGLYLDNMTETGFTVHWTDQSEAETDFEIYLNGSLKGRVASTTRTGTGTGYSFTISGLNPDTTYTVEVKARYYNATDNVTSYSPAARVVRPARPTGLSVTQSGGLEWQQQNGQGYVTLSWNQVSGATGYMLQVHDGNTWQDAKDLGNVTSWDSRTAKIFPAPNWLNSYGNDAIPATTNPFTATADKYDLRDDAAALYAKTAGEAYDSDHCYHFRVVAYTGSYRSYPSNEVTAPQLPDRTDDAPPQVASFSIQNPPQSEPGFTNTRSGLTLNIAASDTESGVDQMMLANDASFTGATWRPYAASTTWDLTSGDGLKRVYLKVKDKSGRESAPVSATIVLDTVPPEPGTLIIKNIDGGDRFTLKPEVKLEFKDASDATSGISQFKARNNGDVTYSQYLPFNNPTDWTLEHQFPGVKQVTAVLKDKAGNESAAVTDEIWLDLDTNAPAATLKVIDPVSGLPLQNVLDLNVTLQVDARDNLTPAADLDISFSNDQASWSPWEKVGDLKIGDKPGLKAWTLASGAEGERTVYARLQDGDGNIGQAQVSVWYGGGFGSSGSVEITPTSNLPAAPLLRKALQSNTGKIDLTVPDNSRNTRLRVSLDGLSWGEWQPVSPKQQVSLPVMLPGGEGRWLVYLQYGDAIGYTTPSIPVEVTVDRTPPRIDLAWVNNAGITEQDHYILNITLADNLADGDNSLQVTLQVQGTGSQAQTVEATNLNKPGSYQVAIPLFGGYNRVTVTATDPAGNQATAAARIFRRQS